MCCFLHAQHLGDLLELLLRFDQLLLEPGSSTPKGRSQRLQMLTVLAMEQRKGSKRCAEQTHRQSSSPMS